MKRLIKKEHKHKHAELQTGSRQSSAQSVGCTCGNTNSATSLPKYMTKCGVLLMCIIVINVDPCMIM